MTSSGAAATPVARKINAKYSSVAEVNPVQKRPPYLAPAYDGNSASVVLDEVLPNDVRQSQLAILFDEAW